MAGRFPLNFTFVNKMANQAACLDHYLDKSHQIISCLETLPSQLKENYHTLRNLDNSTLAELKVVDQLQNELFANYYSFSEEERKERTDKLIRLFKKTGASFDEKVQLATQTYEMVDKHIRRLDADLVKFETDLKERALNPNNNNELDPSPKKRGRKSSGKVDSKKGRKNVSSDDEVSKSSKRKIKAPPLTLELPLALNITHPSDVLDMPVDPNEPTYCFCHQVSYGEMIGCDNPDCPIEWFHFACVGLTSKPKGKWFCSRCSAERKKK